MSVYPPLPDPPPAPVAGSKLWWDASNIDGSNNSTLTDGGLFTTWKDKSGNNNNGTAHGTGATLRKTVADLNNKAAVEFTNNRDETYDFTTPILDIRSVFWVVKKEDPSEFHFLLGVNEANGDVNTWCDMPGGYIWNLGWTSPFILNGVTRVLGEVVNGATTNLVAYGNTIVSLDTTGDVVADYFSGDPRNNYLTNRQWEGTMSELIIYNRVLTAAERETTGRYLSGKYGKNTAYGYPDPPLVTLVYPAATVAAAVGPYALSVKTAATITNRVGLGYETATPDPNEDYYILTQAPQTSVETWSWTLY